METKGIFADYFGKIKTIQESILMYINDTNDQENYQNFEQIFKDEKINENKNKLKIILNIISAISNYQHRSTNFFAKIENILNLLKSSISHHFTQAEIFSIFKNNKRVLLYFFKEQIIVMNEDILLQIRYKKNYLTYFYPEIKDIIKSTNSEEIIKNIKEETIEFIENNFTLFDEKRQNGENDDLIFQLIREDSIDEFVKYVSKTNFPISKEFKCSIYETNPCLMRMNITLIEYAAFFGSIQIFNYLRFNQVKFHPYLWIYAIHGNNPVIIHILEECNLKPNSYEECYKESIKVFIMILLIIFVKIICLIKRMNSFLKK